jgi:hypothetical protein
MPHYELTIGKEKSFLLFGKTLFIAGRTAAIVFAREFLSLC